jgi:hypothetical protein
VAKKPSEVVPLARSEPRTRSALLLESIALRHQIVVLKHSSTSRPCFRLRDWLFWILLARVVAELARQPGDRAAGDGAALAPQQLGRALALSLAW